MADIELVIKIPKEIYRYIMEQMREDGMSDDYFERLIQNGVPLPEDHGRLIDADAYYKDIKNHYFDDATVIRCTEIALYNAPTIIEADKESEG